MAFIIRILSYGLLFWAASSLASDAPRLSSEKLFKKYKPSVVKIRSLVGDLEVGLGAGFFVGPNGELVTNLHVLKHVMEIEHINPVIELSDGRRFTDFEVADCGANAIWISAFSSFPFDPRIPFPTKKAPEQGEKIYVIGHPNYLDWSITDGILSGTRVEMEWNVVQSAPR